MKTEANSGLVDGSLLIRRVSVVQKKSKPFEPSSFSRVMVICTCSAGGGEYCFEPCLSVRRVTQ